MRQAFTLVELVIAILVLGILAGVAAPKMFNTADKSADDATRHSLAVVRIAIEMFRAKNEQLPGADGNQATFKSDLLPYLRKFPTLLAGRPEAQDDQVVMDPKVGPVAGENNPSEGWRYYYKTGEFIVNSKKKLKTDDQLQYDDL